MPLAVLVHTRLLLIRDNGIEHVDGLTPRVALQELMADELGERDVVHDGEAASLRHLRSLVVICELGEVTLDTSTMVLLTPVPLDLLRGVQGGPVLLELLVVFPARCQGCIVVHIGDACFLVAPQPHKFERAIQVAGREPENPAAGACPLLDAAV